MKKSGLILALLAITAIGCKTKNTMQYGMMSCYTLENDEKEAGTDKKSVKLYDEELRIAQTQSYINKLTTSKTDKKFFGFVLADLPDQIITKIKADSSITIIEEKSKAAHETTYYFYKVKKRSGLLLVKVLFKQPKLTNSIVVDAVFDAEDNWTAFYKNSDAFIENLNCKK